MPMRHALAVAALLPLVAFASGDISKVNGSIRVEGGERVGDLSTVNGSIRIEDDVHAANLDTVNGSITVGERSTVRSVKTVNGSIRLQEHVRASSIESVNGSLTVGEDAHIDGEASTVNGAIRLSAGTEVGGKVSSRNGRIVMKRARVAGDVETLNGDVHIHSGSHIRGDIHVDAPTFGFFDWFKRNPKVFIGPDVVIEGKLRFDREVDLHLSERARIGGISGVEPNRLASEDQAVEREDDEIRR